VEQQSPLGWNTTFLSALLLTLASVYALGVATAGLRDVRSASFLVAQADTAASRVPPQRSEPGFGSSRSPAQAALVHAVRLLDSHQRLLEAWVRAHFVLGAILALVATAQWSLWVRLRKIERAATAV
jgi:hypothetical protein